MPEPDRFGYGVNPMRTLSDVELGKVRGMFMWWANTHRLRSPQPPPNFDEVRWSDDFLYVYVSKTSGLDAIFRPSEPVKEGHSWAIYAAPTSVAAFHLLDAIRQVTGRRA